MRRALSAVFVILFISSGAAFLGNFSVSNLGDAVEVRHEQNRDSNATGQIFHPERGLDLPEGIIFLTLAFLAIAIYALDADPFWVALLVLMGIFTGIVYYFSLPMYTIPALILLIAVVAYIK